MGFCKSPQPHGRSAGKCLAIGPGWRQFHDRFLPTRFERKRSASIGLALLALLAAGGCGHGDLADISGKVTLDGAPLADGTINFAPPDQHGPTAGAVIHAGAYKLRLRPGPKTVRIEGFRVIGERPFNPADPNSAMIPTKQRILPEKYNSQTILSCEIGAAGGEFDFKLEGVE